MNEKKMTITDADVQDVREILDSLAMLPPAARQKIQYIIEGAKLVADAAASTRQGGAA